VIVRLDQVDWAVQHYSNC